MNELCVMRNLNAISCNVVLKGLKELKRVSQLSIETNFMNVLLISVALFLPYKLRVLHQQVSESELALMIAPTIFIVLLIYFLGPYTKLKVLLKMFYELRPDEFEAPLRMMGIDKISLISLFILFVVGVAGYFMGSTESILFLGIGFAWFTVLVLACSLGRIVFLLRLRDMFNSTLLNVAGTITMVPLATLLVPGLYSLFMQVLDLATVDSAIAVLTSLLSYFTLDTAVWVLILVEVGYLESKIVKSLESSGRS